MYIDFSVGFLIGEDVEELDPFLSLSILLFIGRDGLQQVE